MTVRTQYPGKGLAWMGGVAAVLGGLMLIVVIATGAVPVSVEHIVFWVIFTPLVLGVGLISLHRGTRWRLVRIQGLDVVVEQGWILHRSSRRHSLSEFRGLHRSAVRLDTSDRKHRWITLLGMAAGHLVAEMANYHSLGLVHSSPSLNLLLTSSEDVNAIVDLGNTISQIFGLPWLTDSTEGLTRVSAATDGALGALPAAPEGFLVEASGDSLRIQMPRFVRLRSVIGVIVFAIVGRWMMVRWPSDQKGVIFLGVGVVFFFIELLTACRRDMIVFTSFGLDYKPSHLLARSASVPWFAFTDIVQAERGEGRGLLLTAGGHQHWLCIGAKKSHLRWLEQAVKSRAAQYKATHLHQGEPLQGGE